MAPFCYVCLGKVCHTCFVLPSGIEDKLYLTKTSNAFKILFVMNTNWSSTAGMMVFKLLIKPESSWIKVENFSCL